MFNEMIQISCEYGRCRNIFLVVNGCYLNDVFKEFDYQSKVDERVEYVLCVVEVKYCYECGESGVFKCCYGCF